MRSTWGADWSRTSARSRGARRSTSGVVAGLVNDGSAHTVARAAAQQAVERGCRVTFLQVAASGLSSEERQDTDRATFRAVLQAMHGLRHVPCTFEVVDGDPATVLIQRSRNAQLLVVGHDHHLAERDVARRCEVAARCDVMTVPVLTTAGV